MPSMINTDSNVSVEKSKKTITHRQAIALVKTVVSCVIDDICDSLKRDSSSSLDSIDRDKILSSFKDYNGQISKSLIHKMSIELGITNLLSLPNVIEYVKKKY